MTTCLRPPDVECQVKDIPNDCPPWCDYMLYSEDNVHHEKYIKVDDAMDIIWSTVELYRSEYDDIRNKLEEHGFEMEAR